MEQYICVQSRRNTFSQSTGCSTLTATHYTHPSGSYALHTSVKFCTKLPQYRRFGLSVCLCLGRDA